MISIRVPRHRDVRMALKSRASSWLCAFNHIPGDGVLSVGDAVPVDTFVLPIGVPPSTILAAFLSAPGVHELRGEVVRPLDVLARFA